MVLKDPVLKIAPVNLKAPSTLGEKPLKGIFDVIFGLTLVTATLPLISAASS